MHQAFDALARKAGNHPFGVTILRGIFAGWLIALMVWLLPAAETGRARVIIIVTYVVGLCQFPHIIAGSTEVFYLGLSGQRSWAAVFGGFIFPAHIGNTIGGVTLVAGFGWRQEKARRLRRWRAAAMRRDYLKEKWRSELLLAFQGQTPSPLTSAAKVVTED